MSEYIYNYKLYTCEKSYKIAVYCFRGSCLSLANLRTNEKAPIFIPNTQLMIRSELDHTKYILSKFSLALNLKLFLNLVIC